MKRTWDEYTAMLVGHIRDNGPITVLETDAILGLNAGQAAEVTRYACNKAKALTIKQDADGKYRLRLTRAGKKLVAHA